MTYDFLVIGGGTAGASSALALTKSGRLLLMKAERRAGSHLTKRSAAPTPRTYGLPVVRQINAIGTKMGNLMASPKGAIPFRSVDAWPRHLKIPCNTATDVTPIEHGGTVPWNRGAIQSQNRVTGKAQKSKYLRETDATNFT